jgi:hypothetical protein
VSASWHPEAVLEPRFRWSFPDTRLIAPDLVDAALGRGIGERMAGLLARRGVTDADGLAAWFAEPLEGLHDPSLLPDADLLAARVALARERAEPVMIFGDFDADGLDGLAILVLALRRYGLTVDPYVPSRLDEGHGLSRRRAGDHHRRHGVELRRGDRRSGHPRDRRDRHRPPPTAAGLARGRCAREPAQV